MVHFVYMLRSTDDVPLDGPNIGKKRCVYTLVGYTTDPDSSVRQHNGELPGQEATKGRQWERVCLLWGFANKGEATTFVEQWQHSESTGAPTNGVGPVAVSILERHRRLSVLLCNRPATNLSFANASHRRHASKADPSFQLYRCDDYMPDATETPDVESMSETQQIEVIEAMDAKIEAQRAEMEAQRGEIEALKRELAELTAVAEEGRQKKEARRLYQREYRSKRKSGLHIRES